MKISFCDPREKIFSNFSSRISRDWDSCQCSQPSNRSLLENNDDLCAAMRENPCLQKETLDLIHFLLMGSHRCITSRGNWLVTTDQVCAISE